jgi:flagellar hook-basal body complex protein FliE
LSTSVFNSSSLFHSQISSSPSEYSSQIDGAEQSEIKKSEKKKEKLNDKLKEMEKGETSLKIVMAALDKLIIEQ